MPAEDVKLMDRPAFEVFDDRPALDKLTRAIMLETGTDYLKALERFQDAWGAARARHGSGLTVAKVLEHAGIAAVGEIDQGVKLLELRDDAVKRQLESGLAALPKERVTSGGQVLVPHDADMGKLLADPEEFERRLHRARRVDPAGTYFGDAGREQFRKDDRLHLDAGVDLVRSMERPREVAAAQAQQADIARQLDGVIADTQKNAARVKELDATIAELQGERAKFSGGSTGGVSSPGQREVLRLLGQDVSPETAMKIMERLKEAGGDWLDAAADVLGVASPASRSASVSSPPSTGTGDVLKLLNASGVR